MDCVPAISPSWSRCFEQENGRAMTVAGQGRDTDAWGILMRAAQDGDAAAYARLLSEITPVMRRVARGRWAGSGAADAEDVVQDALISLHAVRHTYDPARPFMPWLLAILQFRIKDAERKAARRGVHERSESTLAGGLPDRAEDSRDEAPGDGAELARAIADLPEGQRRAVTLMKLEERSLKEAATATGMSPGALKVAVHRGIKALRNRLTGDAS